MPPVKYPSLRSATSPTTTTTLGALVERFRPNLTPFEDLYRDLHTHPELSTKEARTASVVATKLRSLGFSEVMENIGGHGVVAIVRNGPGKTVLLRSELDGLAVGEETGLPYASKVRMEDPWGVQRPVMHACAHDMHTTCLLAAAALLQSAQESWSGTLVLLF